MFVRKFMLEKICHISNFAQQRPGKFWIWKKWIIISNEEQK